MQKAEKIVCLIIELFAVIAVLFLAAMMLLTVCDVILRYFFARPIKGSVEVTELMMVCVGYLGVAWCALQGGHIRVGLIIDNLSERVQKTFDGINYYLLLGLSVLIGTQSFSQAIFSRKLNVTYFMTNLPQYPFILVVSFGFLLLFLATFILIMSLYRKVKR